MPLHEGISVCRTLNTLLDLRFPIPLLGICNLARTAMYHVEIDYGRVEMWAGGGIGPACGPTLYRDDRHHTFGRRPTILGFDTCRDQVLLWSCQPTQGTLDLELRAPSGGLIHAQRAKIRDSLGTINLATR